MRYIRTKYGVYETSLISVCKIDGIMYMSNNEVCFVEILSQSDTIEELCDGICAIERNGKLKVPYVGKTTQDLKVIIDLIDKDNYEVYGAIWTDKGLIYVAKMNEKGELELL